jgi:hypothetical protein
MLLSTRPRLRQSAFAFAVFALVVFGGAGLCVGQSSDVAYPAPVFSEEVVGRIAPRDFGDARRTRHFYIFRGLEGDLSVNVESAELSGDVDVFTATTMRPLVKVTLYGGMPTKASKSVYLRREETLILRVEARAAGDTEGTYRIRFGGSFAPAPAGLAQAPETVAAETASTERTGRNLRRVTSTGARIEEPVVEVPTLEGASASPSPSETSGERAAESTATRREAPRTRRGRGTRAAPTRAKTPTAGKTPAPTATGPEASGEDSTAAVNSATETGREPEPTARSRNTRTTPRTPRRRTAPRRSAPAADAEAATPPESSPPAPVASPRLIIVTKDGETLEREMSTVRRVTVENNQVVVITRDGKTIRQPMANVLKMSIEP